MTELDALLNTVTLPSYKKSTALSRETLAYTSKVALHGNVIGDARNDGNGGSDTIWVHVDHRAEWERVVAEFARLTKTRFEADAALVAMVAERTAEWRMARTLFKRHPNHPVAVAIETPRELVMIGSYAVDEKGIHADVQRQGFDPNLPRRVYRREGR